MALPQSPVGAAAAAVLAFAATAILAAGATRLMLSPWRRAAGAHWTERARLLFRTRFSGGANKGLLLLSAVIAGGITSSDQVPIWTMGGAGIGALFGGVAGARPIQRALFPERSFWSCVSNWAIALTFRAAMLAWLLTAVLSMPHGFRPRVWLVAAIWMAGQWALDAGLLLQVFRLLRLIRPPSDRLAAIIRQPMAESGMIANG